MCKHDGRPGRMTMTMTRDHDDAGDNWLGQFSLTSPPLPLPLSLSFSLDFLYVWIMQFLTKIPHGRLTGHSKGHTHTHIVTAKHMHTYAEEGKSLIVSLLFRYSLQIVCVCVCVWLQVCSSSVCVYVYAFYSAYVFYMRRTRVLSN